MLQTLFSCLDLTSLNLSDTSESIRALCHKATGPLGFVAAFCCESRFVSDARMVLPSGVRLATVVNFPSGQASLSDIQAELDFAKSVGADEIDFVIPYQDILQGDFASSEKAVRFVKTYLPAHPLKVIIESGALSDPALITETSLRLLESGADFIKTSTGKIAVGATLPAAEAILKALKIYFEKTGKRKGLKISGGIKTPADAQAYMALAESYFGVDYLQPQTFRIGASSLIDSLEKRNRTFI